MGKRRRKGRGKGTKCRKKIDDSLRKRVREIGGDKFGVLVVDSSKRNAEVWMTDFYGEPLWDESRTFPITRGHLEDMMNLVGGTCREHGLKDLVVGIEQTGRYHLPVKRALEKRWEVKTIHPFVTKQLRQPASPGVKTDGIDLEAMTRAIISGYGHDQRPFPMLYSKWQLLNRAREDFVDKRATLKRQCQERLHAFMPGYPALFKDLWQNPAALAIAERYGSAKSLLATDADTIKDRLRAKGIRCMRPTLNRVLAWAADAPSPDPAGALNRRILSDNLRIMEQIGRHILRYERDMVSYLVQTPFVLLLSIAGIYVATANRFNRIAFHMVAGQMLFTHPCAKGRDAVLKKITGFSLTHGITPETTIDLVAKAAGQLPPDVLSEELSALQTGLVDLRKSCGVPTRTIKEMAPLLPCLVRQVNHDYKPQGDDDQGVITEAPYRVKAEMLA